MMYLGPRSLDDTMTLDDYMNYMKNMKIKWGERCIAEVTHHYRQIFVGGMWAFQHVCTRFWHARTHGCVCVRARIVGSL